MQLDQLEPKCIWTEFFEICKIPHGSGNVDALRTFLRKRAEERGFKCFEDGFAGNLLIVKEADHGFEHVPTICLQGHLDMVCSKRADCQHDFLKDPIVPRITEVDGKQVVVATGTTLGADDGMGLAAGLAFIFDKSNKCGRIEVLCTKDEETTMHGVHHMGNDFLKAKYLLNLDSEDVGVITIGSAGGFCGDVKFPVSESVVTCPKEKCKLHLVKVFNCSGGHSGVDIHLYKANATKQLVRLLQLAVQYGAKLRCIKGGSAHNAIPMDAQASICFIDVDDSKIKEFNEKAKILAEEIKAEYKTTDANMQITVEQAECNCEVACHCLNDKESRKMVNFLANVPSQVLRMSQDVQGLTESSINMGTIKFCAKEGGLMTLLARSSINSYLSAINNDIKSLCELADYPYEGFRDAYGGWAPNPLSILLKATKKHYAAALGKKEEEIKIEAIHAGLECGELISKYPGLEAVSIGPTIKNPHSDRELCEIATVAPFYECVKNVILELSK